MCFVFVNVPEWIEALAAVAIVVLTLLKPYDAQLIRCYPVSMRINYVANDAEECSAPVELEQTQDRLFTWLANALLT